MSAPKRIGRMTVVSRVRGMHSRDFKFVGADCLDRAARAARKSATVMLSIQWGNVSWLWSKP